MKVKTSIILILLVSCLVFLGPMVYIHFFAKPFIYTDIESVPFRDVGIVLGTSPYMSDGGKNVFFEGRIEATRRLYESGKIRHIIVSGDNSTREYNEPNEMKKALIRVGIPEDKITRDFAGFRTLDSILRAKAVFGQESFIIISQGFHNERAIYLARENGIDAIAFNADPISFSTAPMVYLREFVARIIAIYDVHFVTEATVLGPRENITLTGTLSLSGSV